MTDTFGFDAGIDDLDVLNGYNDTDNNVASNWCGSESLH